VVVSCYLFGDMVTYNEDQGMALVEKVRHEVVTANDSFSRTMTRLCNFSRGVPRECRCLGVSLLCDQVDGDNLCAS